MNQCHFYDGYSSFSFWLALGGFSLSVFFSGSTPLLDILSWFTVETVNFCIFFCEWVNFCWMLPKMFFHVSLKTTVSEPSDIPFDEMKIKDRSVTTLSRLGKGPWKEDDQMMKPCWTRPISSKCCFTARESMIKESCSFSDSIFISLWFTIWACRRGRGLKRLRHIFIVKWSRISYLPGKLGSLWFLLIGSICQSKAHVAICDCLLELKSLDFFFFVCVY